MNVLGSHEASCACQRRRTYFWNNGATFIDQHRFQSGFQRDPFPSTFFADDNLRVFNRLCVLSTLKTS